MDDVLASVDGLLIDIDGVLALGAEVIPGAPETIRALRARGIAIRFMTNTTIYCRLSLLDRLLAMGFDIREGELFTATYAAASYLRSQNARTYYPLLMPDAQLEFNGIEVDEETPEFVVVGDMGPGFPLCALEQGATRPAQRRALVALHKSAFGTDEGCFSTQAVRRRARIRG